ncbi:MFS transporter [Gordonia sp. NPDC003424]
MPGLLALALACCLAVTTEMLPVGLLPAVGDAFGVGASTTGLLVTAFAVMVAVFSVPLTLATRRLPRKPLIVATVSGYLLSNTVIFLAPSFAVVAAGRVIGGLSHALFFAVCIGYVPRLVERAQVGRGLAIVGGGSTAGFVLGVPISTALGTAVGWRNAFLVLAVAAAIALVLIVRLLPAVPGGTPGSDVGVRSARTDLGVVVSSNMLTFIGQYTVYTYIAVVLLRAGAPESSIGPVLLICGVCGLVGLWCTGRTIDRRPRTTVLVVLALLAVAIIGVGLGQNWIGLAVIAVALWNGVFGGVPAIYQASAVRALPDSPEVAGAWINATANVGIALGALIGGSVLQTDAAVTYLAVIGSVLVALGLVVAVVGKRAFPN